MTFRKYARAEYLGTAEAAADGQLRRTAAAGIGTGSYYLDGTAVIDTRGVLSRVAERYNISADPKDYLFEAIRANTTNVPNDNHDGFHRDELLSFVPRVGTAVYLTYREKPHHVNHRADNPKRARGVILDAHYNDAAAPLDVCPTEGCNTRTAERNNRDTSGIHCRKCGSTVKDEFVEILVAIDSTKDPVFAEGVRKGELRYGSMGCNCSSTVCNVCQNVAESKPQFCEHIRASAKGSWWVRANSSQEWERTNAVQLGAEFAKRGLKFSERRACRLVAPDGFEARKAFEYCQGVEFDEYSRVDMPADSTAEQIEILNRAAGLDADDDFRTETEQLIARARRRKRAQNKTAMKFFVVRVDGDQMDTYAAPSLEQAIADSHAEPGSKLEYAEVEAPDAGSARLMQPSMWAPVPADGVAAQADTIINITDGGAPKIRTDGEPPPADQPPLDMADYTEQKLPGESGEPAPPDEQQQLSPEEMGIMPPGAAAEDEPMAATASYAQTYQGWKAQVSPQGNALLVSPRGPALIIKAKKAPTSDEDRLTFGREVMNHLWAHGLFKTAEVYDALPHAKFAQVVEGGMDDMAEFADKQMYDSITADPQRDMRDADPAKPATDVRDEAQRDMQAPPSADVSSVTENRATDMDGASDDAPDSAVSDAEQHSDMRDDPRPAPSLGSDSVLDNAINDRAAALIGKRVAALAEPENNWLVAAHNKSTGKFTLTNTALATREVTARDLTAEWMLLGADAATEGASRSAYEARIKQVYASKRTAELEATRKQALEDVARALRIAARRHALNIESSPLKEALGVVLANDRQVGPGVNYDAMPAELAVHLIEAAYHEAAQAETDRLITRATELMKHDTEYLKSAEADLKKFSHKIPPVVVGDSEMSRTASAAETLRRQAVAGNMELTSQSEPQASGDRPGRKSIKAALKGGIVSSLADNLRR